MRILFLYTELAEYFLSCLDALQKKGVEIHLVHWPVNREAPFQFSIPGPITVYERKKYTNSALIGLAGKVSPDLIFCSGWVDKGYIKVCRNFRGKVPVVVGFDNKWKGTVRQRAAALLSKQLLHTAFTHCWVPGKAQVEFAKRLKFKADTILPGYYSCNYEYFHAMYVKLAEQKKQKFPHRFIFTGRYYEFKGIRDLWKAFIEFKKENSNDWELWCLGTGSVEPAVYPGIKHFGFVQPGDMEKFISETGVYILPSHVEPWGVTAHEFASAGFPLICSDQVGAGEMFLEDGKNGFVFRSGNIRALKDALKKIASLTDAKLQTMGDRSAELAKQVTPEKWASTLLSVLN